MHYQPLLHTFLALYQSLPNKTLKHGEALLPQLMKTSTLQGVGLVWSYVIFLQILYIIIYWLDGDRVMIEQRLLTGQGPIKDHVQTNN